MKVIDLKKSFEEKCNTKFEEAIILHVVGGIASHRQLQEMNEIGKVYEKNRKEYFNHYRNSVFYKHSYFMSVPSEESILMQKLIGMYLYNEENSNGKEFLKKYIISGYKKTHDYVQMNPTINMSNLYMSYRKVDGITESNTTLIGAIALYLGYPSKEITFEPHLREVLYNMLVNCTRLGVDGFHEKERVSNELPALRKFQETMGFKFGKSELIDTLMGKHELFVLNKQLTENERKKIRIVGKEQNYDVLYKKGLIRFWKPFTTIFRMKNLDDMSFGHITITRDELVDIYSTFKMSKEKGRIKEEEYEMFFTASILILSITKHYLVIRDRIQEMFESESGLNKLIEEDKFLEERNQFLETEKEMKQTVTDQSLLISRQQEEIQELTRKLKEQEENNNEYNLLKKEVIALREYAFENENELDFDKDDTSDKFKKNIELLNSKKIAVIGGHPKMHNKLKELLPGIRLVSPEELGIDLSFLNQMDIVCFETTYNNHSQYNRVLNQLQNNKEINLIYINDKNIERIITSIVRKVE